MKMNSLCPPPQKNTLYIKLYLKYKTTRKGEKIQSLKD